LCSTGEHALVMLARGPPAEQKYHPSLETSDSTAKDANKS